MKCFPWLVSVKPCNKFIKKVLLTFPFLRGLHGDLESLLHNLPEVNQPGKSQTLDAGHATGVCSASLACKCRLPAEMKLTLLFILI